MKKTKNIRNKTKKIYLDSIKGISKAKPQIYFSIILFSLITLTTFFGIQNEEINSLVIEKIQEIFLRFEGLGLIQTIFLIFKNNSTVSLLSIFSGLLLSFPPIILIIFNAYVIGFVANLTVQEGGILVLWKLIPHGIFELPAIFISFGLGIRLGLFPFKKEPGKYLKENLISAIKIFLTIILPLLLIAAIIEGFLIFLIN